MIRLRPHSGACMSHGVRARQSNWRPVAGGIAALALLALVACTSPDKPAATSATGTASPVLVEPVRIGDVDETLEAIGAAQPWLSATIRAQIAAVPFNEEEYMERLGIDATFGEAGYSTLERSWGRPTLELNGIWGGFSGDGTKTVLPSEAHAKITCRLVADQDPPEIGRLIEQHVAKHRLPGARVTVTVQDSAARPYLMPVDHPGNRAAREVHLQLYGKEPLYVRSGGSIPVCSMFLDSLGVYTLNFGFGLNDERIHSPNEFFRLASFDRGQVGYCMLLERLGA